MSTGGFFSGYDNQTRQPVFTPPKHSSISPLKNALVKLMNTALNLEQPLAF